MEYTIDQMVGRNVLYNQTMLVEAALASEDQKMKQLGFDLDLVENLYIEEDGDVEVVEVFSWYLVTPWLFERLQDKKEVVLGTEGGYYWGRSCFGQQIVMDSVIESIFNETTK